MNSLPVTVVTRPEEAPNYRRDTLDIRAAKLTNAVVVRIGTVGGNPTVDLQFESEQGEKFVAMVTGAVLETLATVIRCART